MALWNQVQKLSGDAFTEIQAAYGNHFPMEARHFFADWIESQQWDSVIGDSPQHEEWARQLRDDLLQLMEAKILDLSAPSSFTLRLRIQEFVSHIRGTYSNNAMGLCQIISRCLDTEKRCLEQASGAIVGNGQQMSPQDVIWQKLNTALAQSKETERDLSQLHHEEETLIIQLTKFNEVGAHLQMLQNQPPTTNEAKMANEKLQQQHQTNKQRLTQKAQELRQFRLNLVGKYQMTCESLNIIQSQIIDDQLNSWKRQQQLAGIGGGFHDGDMMLDTIQKWCQALKDMMLNTSQQLKRLEQMHVQLPINLPADQQAILSNLSPTISNLLGQLVQFTFIVETQPPQVLKKDGRYTTTIRLLLGGKVDQVKATIISEEQAHRLIMMNDNRVMNENCGNILNNTGHQMNNEPNVTFKNMQLKSIKRAEKKGNETVTEEKFSLLFQSHISIGLEAPVPVWTLSLPVVVTVHGNQECNALATILWDNAFAEPGRPPFQVPEKKLWPEVAQALNIKFEAAVGLGLNASQLNYLASKIFGDAKDYSQHIITRQQFCREPIPGRNFTFWEWFYATLKLTKDWFPGAWKDGRVHGFIDKAQSQEMLLNTANGTFLLRFSDSELGGLTIAWVSDDPKNPGIRQVWNLAPFTDKDFNKRGFGDRVIDIQNLVYLYPDILKSQAFCKFCTPPTKSMGDNGYVQPNLTTVVPVPMCPPAEVMSYDDPATPTMHQPQSPLAGATGGVTDPDLKALLMMSNFSQMDLEALDIDVNDLLFDNTNEG